MQITVDNIKLLIKGISSNNNNERIQCENQLNTLKYELDFYKTMICIITNQNENRGYQIQALVLLKNLLRPELNINKSKFRFLDVENVEIAPILSYLKQILVSLLSQSFNLGQSGILESFQDHLKQIFLLVGDKTFPDNWEELIQFYSSSLLFILSSSSSFMQSFLAIDSYLVLVSSISFLKLFSPFFMHKPCFDLDKLLPLD